MKMSKNKTIITLITLTLLLFLTIIFSIFEVSKHISNKTIYLIIGILVIGIIINAIYLYFKYININKLPKFIDSISDWSVFLAISFASILMIMNFVISTSIVDGESMMPTLEHNERLVVYYFNYVPKLNDMVIIDEGDRYLVKRVVALPGDKIEFIKNDENTYLLYVNNNEQPIKDGFNNNYLIYINSTIWQEQQYLLKEDEVFILGDNGSSSTSSSDSKQNGFYELNNVIGKVVWH